MLLQLHGEVMFGVVVADVFDHVSEQLHIVRQESCFDVAAQDVAEYPAKILVPWIRQEAS